MKKTIQFCIASLLVITTCLFTGAAHAQIITTVAGDGVESFGGDGSAATAARLNNPCGVAVDTLGNIYFADTYNNRIRKINTSGVISTIAGTDSAFYSGDGGPATAAALNYPSGVALDRSGNIYS